MSEIQVTATLKIHDGKLEEFKRVADRCMQSVRTKGIDAKIYSPYQSL